MSEAIHIPASEITVSSVDMAALVSSVFGVSKSAAKRLIKQQAVEVVERNRATKEIERHEVTTMEEYLLTRSLETETLLRCGKNWKAVEWDA